MDPKSQEKSTTPNNLTTPKLLKNISKSSIKVTNYSLLSCERGEVKVLF
jgi:hypothetical protein